MGVRAAAAAVALVAVMGMLAPRAAAQTPNCAAKLVPCSSYMNTTGTPPDTCCGPLKDAVKNDLKCLCDLYATPEIFKAFNISLDEALGLSKRCGLSDTTAACKDSLYLQVHHQVVAVAATPVITLCRSVSQDS
ncbi:Bifunctional inhibitor/lipid-transfer protein/seed storage 2S albumin superfamily protein [Zea mays]|uniref:Bifunctional inhibitor/lipid-transfer protein/seed storage 2S albumin superfamily protein n=1 Tax=Zea mays TaxID=4577 RepID=A0A1D6GTY3_MAIZE|nr:Bifunctional inhibitor/lipid-transfer protein/seed storage 2S albumin superfamily protein [Zea mays]